MHKTVPPIIVDEPAESIEESRPKKKAPLPRPEKKTHRQVRKSTLTAKEILAQWLPTDTVYLEAATRELNQVEEGAKQVLLDGTLSIASEPVSQSRMSKLLSAADKLGSHHLHPEYSSPEKPRPQVVDFKEIQVKRNATNDDRHDRAKKALQKFTAQTINADLDQVTDTETKQSTKEAPARAKSMV